MESKKIDKKQILNLIKEEANFIVKKEEYRNKVLALNEELKKLYENRAFAGTFGFKGDTNSVSGFVDTPNISYIAQLEKEFEKQDASKENTEVINEDELSEIESLKKENEKLKKQMEEISKSISEMKNAK
jgi:capsule polysaccharide export protein KpsE/RkpR